jgi:hypothetical protein
VLASTINLLWQVVEGEGLNSGGPGGSSRHEGGDGGRLGGASWHSGDGNRKSLRHCHLCLVRTRIRHRHCLPHRARRARRATLEPRAAASHGRRVRAADSASLPTKSPGVVKPKRWGGLPLSPVASAAKALAFSLNGLG